MNAMNVASERAREACETCRQSHKKCTYDDNSMRCARCERRNTQCSLFHPNVGPPTSVAYEPAAQDAWPGPASSNFPHQSPPQEQNRWPVPTFAGNTQAEHPAHMIFQSTANPHGNEHPAMNQDYGSYGHQNVFNPYGGA